MKRILYIQHAGSLGGSAYSLLYTMQGVRNFGYEVVVALARPDKKMSKLFSNDGFKVINCDQMVLLDHSTVAPQHWYNPRTYINLTKVLLGWRTTKRRTLELVGTVKPDIVHLNSMPLSACGAALAEADIPFVWHVREPPPDDSWRTRFIRRILLRASELIFLSNYDRDRWVHGKRGIVINNFVDLARFRSSGENATARRALGIDGKAQVILFLGGVAKVKGGTVLLDALARLVPTMPSLICIAPATKLTKPESMLGKFVRVLPIIGPMASPGLNFQRRITRLGIAKHVLSIPFTGDVQLLYAAADLLVFPASKPHFARPIVEAAAIGLPSIGSRLGGIDELIEDEKTGILVAPNDPVALADAIIRVLKNEPLRSSMGANACLLADQRFNQDTQVAKIVAIYRKIAEVGSMRYCE